MSDAERNQKRLRNLRRTGAATFFRQESIFWCGEIDSTNDECRRLTSASNRPGVVVIADHQSAGRGQYGRRWEVPSGLGLLMSFSSPGTPSASVVLSVWGAAATAMMLETTFGLQPIVKWPNDVLIGGRKIAGVLVEVSDFAVVGIGLNVLQSPADFPDDCRLPPTSIAIETGAIPDRVEVAAALLDELERMATPSVVENQSLIFDFWRERLNVQCRDAVVATLYDGASLQGEFLELDLQIGLRMRTESGTVRTPLERLARLEKSS